MKVGEVYTWHGQVTLKILELQESVAKCEILQVAGWLDQYHIGQHMDITLDNKWGLFKLVPRAKVAIYF